MRLREKKVRHGLAADFELKWTKVSPGKADFYLDMLDYFFDDDDLHFRALVVADKDALRHEAFNQDHDTWYYKMMFRLLGPILVPTNQYRVYLDKKDTRSAQKVRRLHDVLCNDRYDFDRKLIERVQVVSSHHVEQLQMADLLMGAVGYCNRGLSGNDGKNAFVVRMRERSHYSLTRTTLLREDKVNILVWRPQAEVSS